MSLLDNLPHRCTIRRLTRKRGPLGGSFDKPVVEQTLVECWEQQASASEIKDYEQRGQKVSRKIFFSSDPGVTNQHEIIITHRTIGGVLTAVAAESQLPLTVASAPFPDAGAGLGVVYRVMVDEWTALRKGGTNGAS